MADQETNQVLLATLMMLRDQAEYTGRLHHWINLIAETIETDAEFGAALKRHPFYRQAALPLPQTTEHVLQRIDALIQRLRG
jgi:hypothetical protein